MVYGAMLTKTNRISRIFHSASQSARRPSYISPRSQLIITAVLVSVQFMATLMWIVAAAPDAEKVYPQRSEVSSKSVSYMLTRCFRCSPPLKRFFYRFQHLSTPEIWVFNSLNTYQHLIIPLEFCMSACLSITGG